MKKVLLLILSLVASIVLVSCTRANDVLDKAIAQAVITYQTGDNADSVTKNVTLPASTKVGKKDVSYSWESSIPSTVSVAGVVTRPFSSSDTSLVLTVTASYEDAAKTKVFPITVKKVDIVSALNIGYAAGDHALSVSKDVTLPSTVQASGYTAQVQWVSSNVGVITSSGAVIHYFGDDTIVRLTATASGSEGQSITKSFDLTVLGYNVDLAIGYAPLENSQNVKHNVTLPSSVSASGISASVTWSSSNASVVSASGVVSRPFGDATSVTLSATITTPAASTTKIYVVSVIGIPTSLVTESAAIEYSGEDNENSVTSDVVLPTSATIDGVSITYTWASSNSAAVDENGTVNKQAEDTEVTLTYTAHNGVHTYSSAFVVTVAHLESGEEYDHFPYEVISAFLGVDVSGFPEVDGTSYVVYNGAEVYASVELDIYGVIDNAWVGTFGEVLESHGFIYDSENEAYLDETHSYFVIFDSYEPDDDEEPFVYVIFVEYAALYPDRPTAEDHFPYSEVEELFSLVSLESTIPAVNTTSAGLVVDVTKTGTHASVFVYDYTEEDLEAYLESLDALESTIPYVRYADYYLLQYVSGYQLAPYVLLNVYGVTYIYEDDAYVVIFEFVYSNPWYNGFLGASEEGGWDLSALPIPTYAGDIAYFYEDGSAYILIDSVVGSGPLNSYIALLNGLVTDGILIGSNGNYVAVDHSYTISVYSNQYYDFIICIEDFLTWEELIVIAQGELNAYHEVELDFSALLLQSPVGYYGFKLYYPEYNDGFVYIDVLGLTPAQIQSFVASLDQSAFVGYRVLYEYQAIKIVVLDPNPVFPYEELEEATGLDLSDLPDPSWIGYNIYSALEGIADIELSYMFPSEYEGFASEYGVALLVAGYTYDEIHDYYISPDGSYTVKLYDFYASWGTYDLVLQEYEEPETAASWEEVEEYISDATYFDWEDALYHDPTVTGFEISYDGSGGYYVVLLGLESLADYKAGLEELGYVVNSSYVSENEVLYQLADGEYYYDVLVGFTSTSVYLDVWVSIIPASWEEIVEELEYYTGLDLSLLPDPGLNGYNIYHADPEWADVELTISLSQWNAFVASYGAALLEAGFTYNEDGDYYLAPDETYITYLDGSWGIFGIFDLYIEAYYPPVPAGEWAEVIAYLESFFGVSFEGLLYEDPAATSFVIQVSGSEVVVEVEGVDVSTFVAAYGAELLLLGYEIDPYYTGTVYSQVIGDYQYLVLASIYAGAAYIDVLVLPAPVYNDDWAAIVEELEYYTGLDLSDLPDPELINYNIYGANSQMADVELTISSAEWDAFVVSYGEALLEAGFEYVEDGDYYISPNGTYIAYLMDYYDFYGTYDLIIEPYTAPVEVGTWDDVVAFLEEFFGVSFDGILYDDPSATGYNIVPDAGQVFVYMDGVDTSTFIASYGEQLLLLGFTLDPSYTDFAVYTKTVDGNTYLALPSVFQGQAYVDVLVRIAPTPGFPYADLEAALGVTLEGLLPDIFDDTEDYDLYGGVSLIYGEAALHAFVDIFDGPVDTAATLVAYGAGLVENGFTFEINTSLYGDPVAIYYKDLGDVTLHVGVQYSDYYEVYTLAFWVVDNAALPPSVWEAALAAYASWMGYPSYGLLIPQVGDEVAVTYGATTQYFQFNITPTGSAATYLDALNELFANDPNYTYYGEDPSDHSLILYIPFPEFSTPGVALYYNPWLNGSNVSIYIYLNFIPLPWDDLLVELASRTGLDVAALPDPELPGTKIYSASANKADLELGTVNPSTWAAFVIAYGLALEEAGYTYDIVGGYYVSPDQTYSVKLQNWYSLYGTYDILIEPYTYVAPITTWAAVEASVTSGTGKDWTNVLYHIAGDLIFAITGTSTKTVKIYSTDMPYGTFIAEYGAGLIEEGFSLTSANTYLKVIGEFSYNVVVSLSSGIPQIVCSNAAAPVTTWEAVEAKISEGTTRDWTGVLYRIPGTITFTVSGTTSTTVRLASSQINSSTFIVDYGTGLFDLGFSLTTASTSSRTYQKIIGAYSYRIVVSLSSGTPQIVCSNVAAPTYIFPYAAFNSALSTTLQGNIPNLLDDIKFGNSVSTVNVSALPKPASRYFDIYDNLGDIPTFIDSYKQALTEMGYVYYVTATVWSVPVDFYRKTINGTGTLYVGINYWPAYSSYSLILSYNAGEILPEPPATPEYSGDLQAYITAIGEYLDLDFSYFPEFSGTVLTAVVGASSVDNWDSSDEFTLNIETNLGALGGFMLTALTGEFTTAGYIGLGGNKYLSPSHDYTLTISYANPNFVILCEPYDYTPTTLSFHTPSEIVVVDEQGIDIVLSFAGSPVSLSIAIDFGEELTYLLVLNDTGLITESDYILALGFTASYLEGVWTLHISAAGAQILLSDYPSVVLYLAVTDSIGIVAGSLDPEDLNASYTLTYTLVTEATPVDPIEEAWNEDLHELVLSGVYLDEVLPFIEGVVLIDSWLDDGDYYLTLTGVNVPTFIEDYSALLEAAGYEFDSVDAFDGSPYYIIELGELLVVINPYINSGYASIYVLIF